MGALVTFDFQEFYQDRLQLRSHIMIVRELCVTSRLV